MKKLLRIWLFASITATTAVQAQASKPFKMEELPVKHLNELVSSKMISGANGTLGYFTFKKGAVVPMHQHLNEQYSLMVKGSVNVALPNGITTLKTGEGNVISPNTPHSFTALEEGTADIDFFSPARTNWMTGNDQYFNSIKIVEDQPLNGKVSKPEKFASVDMAVGNITFTPEGDLVYSHHPFFEPRIRVMRYDSLKKISFPFPNLEWNTPRLTDDHYLSNVLGVRNDENGIIWMLDMGQRNAVTPKIVGWNMHTNALERIYYLPKSALVNEAQPNDMIVDTKHGVFVIADEGIGNGGDGSKAALIVVDMKTGASRRLLQGTRTTKPEASPTVIGGKHLAVKGKDLLVGCDGITADRNFEWMYYGPLNGSKIYRVKITDLLDPQLTEEALDNKIETYAQKPNNGGFSMDVDGNLYMTAMESNGVSIVLSKDRSIHQLIKDKDLLWPDGVSYNAADGYMYVSAAQVHLGAVFNDGVSKAKPPFYIYRFKPLVSGVPFR